MSSPWPLVKLGEVTINHDARRVPVRESNRKPGPYPYYGASGVVDYVDGYLFEGLHLLIAEDGENLRTRQTPVAFLADGRFWVNNHAHIVVGNERADTRYLCYALAVTDISGYLTGSAMPKLSQRSMNGIELPLPPLDVQLAIAETLGSLDNKIEQNRRMGQALECLARATFKAWFLDFEPVKVKAAGATSFPGMPHAAFTALPDRLAESQRGTVREGWDVKTVGDVTRLSKQQIKPQDHPDELFEHFSIPAYDVGQNPVVEPGSGIMSQKFVVVPDCVLLSKLNPRIPRVWIPAPANGRRQIASMEFLVAVPRSRGTREFLYCLFQQREFRDTLAQSASGTSSSHQRVRPSDLLAHPLVVPPKTVLNAFTDQARALIALREALQAEATMLATLRDYLLPRLLSGRVRVRPSQAEAKT
jgi:type I restriction enzyme S subunit